MILLFGPTGAGKSMQGQMLAVRQGWKWLSTGEMLRQSTDEELIAILKSGELVSDELTYQVFEEAVQDARDKQYGNIIIDGFPRTKEQAAWLDEYMATMGEKIDIVSMYLSSQAACSLVRGKPSIIILPYCLLRASCTAVSNTWYVSSSLTSSPDFSVAIT
jgi:adenylate kinase